MVFAKMTEGDPVRGFVPGFHFRIFKGTSGNLISEKSPKFSHLRVGHKPYEFLQKARCALI